MVITAFEPRRKGLYQLYIDGEAAVKVDMQVFMLSGYKAGSDITDEELYELIKSSDERRAREKALYLLEHRSHSKKELKEKIIKSGVPKETAEAAAGHMEEIGLVNDAEYARNYARMLFDRKQFGVRRVRQELKLKGITEDIIEEVIGDFSPEYAPEVIQNLLMRKYPLYAEDEKVKKRAVSAMMRLGYSYDDIKTAMNADFDEY